MPTVTTQEAIHRLAVGVESAKTSHLGHIYTELFPQKERSAHPPASEIARIIRNGLEPEEIVDLWNVVFPKDRGVRYDEETDDIHYNESMLEYAD